MEHVEVVVLVVHHDVGVDGQHIPVLVDDVVGNHDEHTVVGKIDPDADDLDDVDLDYGDEFA